MEHIELKYLNEISWYLSNEKDKIINLLQTKERIRNDWKDKFDRIEKKKQTGEMARGSERVFGMLFPNTWRPNSSPIGSDFMFETVDAIIHVDMKTTRYSNKADHRGKVPIGNNQTSYSINNPKCEFKANLPTFYTIHDEREIKKMCVTGGDPARMRTLTFIQLKVVMGGMMPW